MENVSWPELPVDLINKIYEHITTISDYIIFRAVCKTWRYSVHPHSLPLQQPPWLYFHNFNFFTRPNSKKLQSLPLPFANDSTTLLGSSYGYLVLHSQHVLSLFNPISLSCIKLPIHKCNNTIEKVVISPPLAEAISTVVVIFRGSSHLGICQAGLNAHYWTFMDEHIYIHDAIYFEDKFYVVDSMRRIFVLDAENACLKSFSGVPVGSITYACDGDRIKCYLVGCDSNLFLVIRCISRMGTKGFTVFGRDRVGEYWKQVKSLMTYSVFLGLNQSVMMDGKTCSGFRSNCVYFLEDDYHRLLYGNGYLIDGSDVGVFDMSSGKVGAFPYAALDDRIIGSGDHGPFLWFTPTLL